MISFRAATAGERARPLVMTLATVDAAGMPRARSVICRLIDDVGALYFTTDARSAKHDQLAARPVAEAVCWLPAVKEQYRFFGRVELRRQESGSPQREQVWRELSPQSRAMFFWPTPGSAFGEAGEEFALSSDAPHPPPSFELVILRAEQVDRLELFPHPHRRRRWTLATNWNLEELNP